MTARLKSRFAFRNCGRDEFIPTQSSELVVWRKARHSGLAVFSPGESPAYFSRQLVLAGAKVIRNLPVRKVDASGRAF